LVEAPLKGYFRFSHPNPYSNLKPIALSLTSDVLYDEVPLQRRTFIERVS
jgi:hypothetical protein